ncbi:hypothetical protein H8356DRAFT_1706214 [Neocallimastix lanati (nom. inval.)]|nr:hypothetical protein H8356DRAFT_1706214 [Neocallimastix sp. JGI-2020a]
MSVITNELSNSFENFIAKVNKDHNKDQTFVSGSLSSSHGSFFILNHEPTGVVSSSPRRTSNTGAVSIPYSSKYRRNQRIRLSSTSSPSTSSLSSATASGSISHQSLKESLNKTISSIIENYQEKVIIHNSSPSSSYSFTKHSTIIYSPSKSSSSLSSSFTKSKLSQNNIFPIKKIKPISLNKETKLSEITFGLKKKDSSATSTLRKSNSDVNLRKVDVEISDDKLLEKNEKRNDSSGVQVNDDVKEEKIKKEEVKKEDLKKDEVQKEEIPKKDYEKEKVKEITKEEVKNEVKKILVDSEKIEKSIELMKSTESTKPVESKEIIKSEKSDKSKKIVELEKSNKSEEIVELAKSNKSEEIVELEKSEKSEEIVELEKPVELEITNEKVKKDITNIENETEKSEEKEEGKIPSSAKLEAKKNKEILPKKKPSHKKTLSLPNILTPLTPLSGMDDVNPPTVRKRRKSVNFSLDNFKSICHFTTTDKPECIRNSVVEVKIDDPESDKKDKEFSELRNYENAWSPVPRNVIHIQKFKSSKAKHVQYELPVSVQSFKLVRSNSEETEDKLTCLKVTLNVQNLSYEKKVVIRYTVDKWKTFKEVEAKYVKCIREATKDEGDDIKGIVGLERFVARIDVSKFFVLEEKPGHICNQRPTKMLLVARYEVNNNTYWDNNDFTDYHIELVRINAGYDVPRVSKHGKPIPCPGCCMTGKQSNSIEDRGKEVKNNKRTVRKIGGVFGNFTEAVSTHSDRTNFVADKEKIKLYMGIDGNGNKNSTTATSSSSSYSNTGLKKKVDSSSIKVVKGLTEEPESIIRIEEKPKVKTSLKKKTSSMEKMSPSNSYGYGCSSSQGGNPMYSMSSGYPVNKMMTTSSSSTTSNTNILPSSSFNNNGIPSYPSSKYDPPMSTTSSIYSNGSMGMSSFSYGSNSSNSPYSMSSHSKYEPYPYNGGTSAYDSTSTSIYGPSTNSFAYGSTVLSSFSKYNPPNEYYPENNFSKYDPPNYYSRSYSNPSPSVTATSTSLSKTPSQYDPSTYGPSSTYGSTYSSSNRYDPYDSTSNQISTQYGNFSEYNFGIDLKKKVKTTTDNDNNNNHQKTTSTYSGSRTNSKYDIPFSTYSSFGDNFSNYYSVSPSTLTY